MSVQLTKAQWEAYNALRNLAYSTAGPNVYNTAIAQEQLLHRWPSCDGNFGHLTVDEWRHAHAFWLKLLGNWDEVTEKVLRVVFPNSYL